METGDATPLSEFLSRHSFMDTNGNTLGYPEGTVPPLIPRLRAVNFQNAGLDSKNLPDDLGA